MRGLLPRRTTGLERWSTTDIVMPDNVRPLDTSSLDMDTILASWRPAVIRFYRQRYAQKWVSEFYTALW